MAPLLSTQETILKKIKAQQNPTLLIADVDGTLFSPNFSLLTAPLQNRKTANYLKKNSIPFVVATGRSDWKDLDRRHISLLGLPQPDSIITANGTVIYQQLANKLFARDMEWEAMMQYSKVTWADGKVEPWNKSDISSVLKDYFATQQYKANFGIGNTFLIRIKLLHIPYPALEEIRKDILTLFPLGVRVLYTEKLLRKNTLHIFSGELLITPKLGGKENAVRYLLEKYAKQTRLMLHAFIFGDATVDMPMLTMRENLKYYTLSQYLVHPTPMAQKAAIDAKKTNLSLHILPGDGPKQIFNVLQGNSTLHESNFFNLKEIEQAPQEKQNKPTALQQSSLSPAQNNPLRQVVRKFEPLLDRIVNKKLSPNEVSFLGLTKLSEGLNQIYSEKPTVFQKTKGVYNYAFGNLTDVLDGIRARNSVVSRHSEQSEESHSKNTISNDSKESSTVDSTPGQLVDGFSDRAKEFMQLFIRGKKRLEIYSSSERARPFEEGSPSGKSRSLHSRLRSNNNISVIARSETTKQPQSLNNQTTMRSIQTFLTAISCTLPSIARAQAEIVGKVVAEKDEKGGSMIDRTKKLFLSLLMDTIGAHQKSEAIDQLIYSTNIATFKNRISVIPNASEKSLARHPELVLGSLTDFQKKALERWLLYIDVLQQEDAVIKKYLAKYSKHLKEYEKESQKLAKDYLLLDINKLRKKWKIKDYKLQIKMFLI